MIQRKGRHEAHGVLFDFLVSAAAAAVVIAVFVVDVVVVVGDCAADVGDFD